MSTNKKKPEAFTSFRILGQRAQEFLQKARKQKSSAPTAEDKGMPVELQEPDVHVGFSGVSVAKSTAIVLIVIACAWMMFVLRDKLILLLLGFFVAAIIDPGVVAMERWRIPRGVGVLLHYFIALFFFVFLLVSLIPIIAQQLQQIAVLISEQVNTFLDNPQISLPLITPEVNRNLTELVRATLENLSINKFADTLQTFGQNLGSFAGGSVLLATRIAGSVVGFFVKLIIVLVLAFFIQVEKEHIRSWFRSFFPLQYRRYLDTKTDAIHHKIGRWARGQLVLSLCIGLLVCIALVILRMPYAATLAVLAAFTEFIPYIGPFIAAIPAVLIAVTQGGLLWALIVAGIYYVVQWCENNLLVPLIMKRAVGLSPIAIIFAMLVGVSFPGIVHPVLGILLAVPATTIITLFIEDWREMRQRRGEA